MLAALAKFTHRFRLLILLAGLAFVLAGLIYGTKVFDHLSQGGFDDTRSDSYQASRIITERLGQTDASLLVLFSSGDAKVTDPTYQSAVTVALSQVTPDPSVRQVTTYYTSGEQSLVSQDQKSTYAVISLAGTEQEQQKAVQHPGGGGRCPKNGRHHYFGRSAAFGCNRILCHEFNSDHAANRDWLGTCHRD